MISIGESEKVTIFFLRGGKRIFYTSSPDLEQVDSHHPILELGGAVNWMRAEDIRRDVEAGKWKAP